MVFIAFSLLTVSTLAVHGKITSTDGPVVPRGCEGKTFCNVKPPNYPQNEIDRYLESNPAYLQRLKRQAELAPWSDACQAMKDNMAELEDGSNGGNCRTDIRCEYPFEQRGHDNRVSQVIVQSKFFKQSIPQVRCLAKEAPCLENFTRKHNTKCEEVAVSTKIFVWDKLEQKVQNVSALIYVDCVCVYK